MTRLTWSLLLVVTALSTVPGAMAGQFKKPVYYKVGALPYSIVTADFNNDGNLDLAVSDLGSNQISILLGKGDGSFHPARTLSVPSCAGLAVGDFNGDHIPDLAVVEYAGSGTGVLGVYLGKGDGTFHNSANYVLGRGPVWDAVADFNGDGRDDVAVANSGPNSNGKNGSVMVFLGKGNGTFGKPTTYELPNDAPFAIAAGDLTGDNHPDIVVTSSANRGSVLILMNNGLGKFKHTETYAAGFEPFGVTIAKLEHGGTGNPDLVVASVTGIAVLLGHGDGTFGNATFYSTNGIGQGPSGVVVSDFNLDGNPDIAAGLFNGNSALLYGKGDGTFKPAIPIKIKTGEVDSLTVGDFANDQAPDLAIAGSGGNSAAVLINAQ